jgi:hypothetical protein
MSCNASYARFIFGKFFVSTIILYVLLFAQNFFILAKSGCYRLSGKADPGIDPGSGKAEPGPSYGCGLQEESEPILGKENNEGLVTKKSESENVGSPIDEEKMEPMKEYDLVKGGGMIRTDWRLPF